MTRMWAAPVPLALASALTMLLGGCGADGGGQVKSTAAIRAEAACDVKGLAKPLRQTLILVDAKALRPSSNGQEFAANNKGFRDLVLSIADPASALPTGNSAARERIVIAVVPVDGSPAQTSFTGCLPGMSEDELAAARRDEGMLGKAFSSGAAKKLEDQAEEFRLQLIGGMVNAARRAAPAAEQGGADAFFTGVRASRGLFEDDKIAHRLVLVSDVGRLATGTSPGAAQRKAGVAKGRADGGDFGRADVHVALPEGRDTAGRAFFEGYFLAQEARLASYGVGRIAGASRAPARLWRFSGQAAYPSGRELIELRIADDGQGRLTSSWLTTLTDPRFAVPMTGQITCAGQTCRIRSDKGGFAQAWTDDPGGAPEFRNDLPFGGMRDFDFEIAGTKLSGRVFDTAVHIEGDASKNSITVTADGR